MDIYKITSIKIHSDKVFNGLNLVISQLFNEEELFDTLDVLVTIHLNLGIRKNELEVFIIFIK